MGDGWAIEQGYGADDVPLTPCAHEGCTHAATNHPETPWYCEDHPPYPYDGQYTAEPRCSMNWTHHLGKWCIACQGWG